MVDFKQNYFQRRTKDRGPRSNNRISSPEVQVIESDGSLSFDTESESTTKVKALSYTETIPVLLKAIQELESKVKALESK